MQSHNEISHKEDKDRLLSNTLPEVESRRDIKRLINREFHDVWKYEHEDIIGILKRIPEAIRGVMYYFLLSDLDNKKYLLEEFLSLGITTEAQMLAKVNHPIVRQIFRKARSVQRQIHKWKGMLRFREVEGGYLYASFESEFDVLLPITRHFAERFNTEKLIIHDLKRNKAVYVEYGEIYPIELTGTIPPGSDGEKFFQELWKLYFNTIGIEQRGNRELQNRCIPKKFQRWLCEFTSNEKGTSLPDKLPSSQLELF